MKKLNAILKRFGLGRNYKIKSSIEDKIKPNEELIKRLADYLSKFETQTKNYDYQEAMNYLYTRDVLMIKKTEEEEQVSKEEKQLTEEEKEKIIQKLDKEQQIKSNLFNPFSMKIFQHTDNQHLINIANKSFVGDTDIPKDFDRSMVLLEIAKSKAMDRTESKDINFYIYYLSHLVKCIINLIN